MMQKWALIIDSTVTEITDIDPTGRFPQDFKWIQCADEIHPGWTYDGQKLSAPNQSELDICAVRVAAKAQIAAMLEAAASAITEGTPLAEQLSWPVKQEAARAYQVGTATDAQKVILEAEANVTGETLDVLCNTILAAADRFAAAVGTFAGLRRSSTAAIDAPDTKTSEAIAAAVAEVDEALKSSA